MAIIILVQRRRRFVARRRRIFSKKQNKFCRNYIIYVNGSFLNSFCREQFVNFPMIIPFRNNFVFFCKHSTIMLAKTTVLKSVLKSVLNRAQSRNSRAQNLSPRAQSKKCRAQNSKSTPSPNRAGVLLLFTNKIFKRGEKLLIIRAF